MELAPTKVSGTGPGASGDDVSSFDDEPMCKQMGSPAAEMADHSGSQWSVYTDGIPMVVGFSEKAMARTPVSATRSTSATAAGTSHKGTIATAASRSGSAGHHSSATKSL